MQVQQLRFIIRDAKCNEKKLRQAPQIFNVLLTYLVYTNIQPLQRVLASLTMHFHLFLCCAVISQFSLFLNTCLLYTSRCV